MPRAYGRLLFLQDGSSEGFFTASFQVSGYALSGVGPLLAEGVEIEQRIDSIFVF
jgi:hypothetical protein